MALVVALDQRFDQSDLELGRLGRKSRLHLIEREHHLEIMLELELRHLRMALELDAYPPVESAGVACGEVAGRTCFGRGTRLDDVRETPQPVGQPRQTGGRGPARFGLGHAMPRGG